MSDKRLSSAIRASREKLENPYAYLDGEGNYSADKISHASVHAVRRDLENPYAYLDADGKYSEFKNVSGSDAPLPVLKPADLLGPKRKGQRFSKTDIETIVRRLQLRIWNDRESIWHNRRDLTPVEVLDPVKALELIGFTVDLAETLGFHSVGTELFEVAGTVDDQKRQVQLSRQLSPEVCNFTAAHELAHAVLHHASGLHRDRAQDGGAGIGGRDEREIEADIFAANFLMPEKQTKAAFKRMFLTDQFRITEDSAFALIADNIGVLEKKCRTSRDLAKLLASTEQYGGRHFHSLAHQFRVSIEAMAIRLEELNLLSR